MNPQTSGPSPYALLYSKNHYLLWVHRQIHMQVSLIRLLVVMW
jgi:hypothetical protein